MFVTKKTDMNITRITQVTLTLCLIISLASCKKKGCTDPLANNYSQIATEDDGSCQYDQNTAAQPAAYTPSFASDMAALVAIKTVTTTTQSGFTIDSEVGTGVAVFTENAGVNYLEAGTVSLNSNTLTKNDNNSYTFIPSQSAPTGITFGTDVDWNATGGAWPSFTASSSVGFSTVSDISSGDVSLSSDYTLNCSSIANADSVYFGIYGPDNSEYVIVDGNTTSYTFTASQISALGAGQGFVQIVGLKYDPQTVGSKDYWLINETVRTKSVTIE